MSKFFRLVDEVMRKILQALRSDPPKIDAEMKEEVLRRQENIHARLRMLELEADMKDQKYMLDRRRAPRS